MNMLGEEPPYLSVGTEVSAKYKGAFCEAKVRKVDRNVKCKVAFKLGFGSHTVLDNQIKGLLRVGANVEARHPEKKELVEGTITKIQDCSQYTVVFDDGDITTLRRSALCLKSGRHFAESETLDQLPLTHPEHFGNPVVGGRRGGRRRLGSDESSGEEEVPRKGRPREERETEIGKVVCVELGDKKKVKDNWFPGLVVAPNAQDTVRIRVKEEFLVRSFKDARYYTVPKKEATEFTREIGLKVDNNTLKAAVEKALTFLDRDELPPHWDREQLFSLINSDDSDSDAGLDSDSSDDEPREEKDHFVAQLYKFMDDRGTPINVCPSVCSRDLDLYKLFKLVHKMNGYNRVSNHNQWKLVSAKLGFGNSPGVVTQVKHAYKRFLHSFEDFYRKLGCTMVNHPRAGRARNRGGRSLIRDKDRATPVNVKPESGATLRKEDEGPSEEIPPAIEVKKIEVRDDEAKSKPKVEECSKAREKEETRESETPSDTEPVRSASTLRKKFPTLKASPRTKDESPALKRRAEGRPPSTRPKRALRENSMDDGRTSGEESSSIKASQGPDEQRSTTRAKSKEDQVKQLVKKDTSEARSGKSSSKSSDSDGSKKGKSTESEDAKKLEWSKGKRPAGEDANANAKRSRKQRNTEGGVDEAAPRPSLPRNKSVVIGDVLKVYYGSSNDPNGIYEAKVIDMDVDDSREQLYLVHYAGWNSRYDEWVKRSKIAENLTWAARRAKSSPVKGARMGSVKKKSTGGKGEPTRSTTPSSITSSSSRTKSPATPVTTRRRVMRRDGPPGATPGTAPLRRTRRLSGHTEVSVDSQSDSESDLVDSESDSEAKSEDPTGTDTSKKKDSSIAVKKTVMRTRPTRKPALGVLPQVVEKRKPRVLKNTMKAGKETEEKGDSEPASKRSEYNDDNEEMGDKSDADLLDSPKGRDFDLNEIRSELKGIDKAVKVAPEVEVSGANDSEADDADTNEEGEITVLDVRLVDKEDKKSEVPTIAIEEPVLKPGLKEEDVLEVKEEPSTDSDAAPILEPEEKMIAVEDVKDDDDIYEFKEPEPFEFQEVRRQIRIFDDIIEKSPEKSIAVKNISVATSPMRATFEKKDASPQDDVKGRFRKTIVKKIKESVEEKRVEAEVKTEGEVFFSKEAPQLEVELDLPPQLVPLPEVPKLEVPETLKRDRKASPEPQKRELLSRKASPEPQKREVASQKAIPEPQKPRKASPEPRKRELASHKAIPDPLKREVSSHKAISDSLKREVASHKVPSEPQKREVASQKASLEQQKREVASHKASPEPPCLVPVTEALPCLPPEHSPVLTREDPPRLSADISSSDSESDERLVIANDDESTSSDVKLEPLPPPPVPSPPPPLVLEERKETKRSPLSEIRLKRVEDRLKIANSTPVEPQKKISQQKPSTSGLKVPTDVKDGQDRDCSDSEGPAATGAASVSASGMRSLVCDEVIPGSPAPKDPTDELPFQPPAACVMDNTPPTTPPTTPDSSVSSPREDRVGRLYQSLELSSLDNESSKSHRDSSEVDLDHENNRSRGLKYEKRKELSESPLKKKRNRKRSESTSEPSKRGAGRIGMGTGRGGRREPPASDSDDTSESSVGAHGLDPLLTSRSPRPSMHNFCKELGPDLDSNQRIAFLQQQLQDLRKVYNAAKSQLASLDRRRKKMRRKDREEKLAAATLAAAATALKSQEAGGP